MFFCRHMIMRSLIVSADTPSRSADEEPEFPPERQLVGQRSRRPAVITWSVPVVASIRNIRLPQNFFGKIPQILLLWVSWEGACPGQWLTAG